MKKLMIVLMVPVAIVAALTVLEVSGGCGLLGAADEIWIGPITQTFDFDLNANDIRTLLATQLQIDLTGLTEFPAGVNVQQSLDMETPPEKVDLTGEQDLKKYVEAGKVNHVKIESVKYNISQNTLNYDLPDMEMYMDDYEVTKINTATSKLIATLPTITAGTTGPGEVQWAPDGQNILSDFLMSFKFAIIGKATVEIDTTRNRAIPAGQMAGTVEVKVKFSVDPL
jgi:hypothetical protein